MSRRRWWTRSHAISFVCLSLKCGGAHVGGHMTGQSVRTRILGKRLAGGTPGSFTTLARRARSFGKETARRAIHASLLMACSSAGSTLLVTGLSLARMGPVAAGEYVSSLTRRSSSGFFLSRVLGIMGRPSHTTAHLSDSLLTRICPRVHLFHLRLRL